MTKISKSWRVLGLILGLVTLFGAFFFYWQSLVYEFVPVRVPMPKADLKLNPGMSASWPVPPSLVSKRWYRTGVRVWEEAKALPVRVEDEALVKQQGAGRFCVQDQTLWFSASDGSNPLANGRNYQFEVLQPTYRKVIIASILFALAAALFLLCLPWRRGLTILLQKASEPKPGMRQLFPVFAISSLLLLALLLFQVWAPVNLCRWVPITAEFLLQQPEGHSHYYLPRWVRKSPMRVETVQLWEDQKLLTRASLQDVKQSSPGAYGVEKDYLAFRPSTAPVTSPNGHRYRLKIFLFPSFSAFGLYSVIWWALFSGGASLLLFGQSRGVTRDTDGRPHFRSAFWWVPILSVSLCKLWVVAGDDSSGQLGDGWAYAMSANALVWGKGGIDWGPSGFPFVAGLVAQLGLPWRIALELMYLGATTLMACALAAGIGSHLVGFILFFLMAWHPWTLSGFREFMSDPFLLVILVALLAQMFRLLSQPAAKWKPAPFFLLGALLFLWYWNRREDPLLFASYGLFVCCALILLRAQPAWTWRSLPRLATLLLLPLLLMFVLGTAVKSINYQQFGLYAKCRLDAPGLSALVKTLYRVKSETPLPYAPVTRQSLAAACDLSPSLQPFKQALLDPHTWAAELGQDLTKVPGEFGSHLLSLLGGILPDPVALKAAAEIQTALREGRLPKRQAWFPLDPNWHFWLPRLPATFCAWLGYGISMDPSGEPWGSYHNVLMQHELDLGANRRAANVYTNLFIASGAVISPPGALDSVILADPQERSLAASVLGQSNWWTKGQTFDLRIPLLQDPISDYQLLFVRKGKTLYRTDLSLVPLLTRNAKPDPFSRTASRQESNATLSETGQTFSYFVNAKTLASPKRARREAFENFLYQEYQPTLFCLLLLAGFCALLETSPQRLRLAAVCLLLIAGCFIGRVAAYSILEANFGWGTTRYIRCASPLFIPVLLLALITTAAFLRKWVGRTLPDKTPSSSSVVPDLPAKSEPLLSPSSETNKVPLPNP